MRKRVTKFPPQPVFIILHRGSFRVQLTEGTGGSEESRVLWSESGGAGGVATDAGGGSFVAEAEAAAFVLMV